MRIQKIDVQSEKRKPTRYELIIQSRVYAVGSSPSPRMLSIKKKKEKGGVPRPGRMRDTAKP